MSIKREKRIPIAGLVLLGHTLVVLAMAFMVYTALPAPDSKPVDDIRILWGLFLFVDFPSSIISGLLLHFTDTQLNANLFGICNAVIIPATLFTVFGGAQYYLLTNWYLGYIRHRRGKQRYHEHRCIECGYNLTGNTSGRCPECNAIIP